MKGLFRKMEKSIEYNILSKLSYKDIKILKDGKTLYAYKIEKHCDGELLKTVEGICFEKDLEFLAKKSDMVVNKYSLCKKSIEDKYINESPSDVGFYNSINDYIIKEPYSYIQNNDDWEIYIVSTYSNTLYDVDENELPQMIHVEYIMSHFTNENYDLKSALKILKTRKDIIFAEGEAVVSPIPYYNSTDICNKYIDFYWKPNNKDYEELKKQSRDNRYKYLIQNILGIKPL